MLAPAPSARLFRVARVRVPHHPRLPPVPLTVCPQTIHYILVPGRLLRRQPPPGPATTRRHQPTRSPSGAASHHRPSTAPHPDGPDPGPATRPPPAGSPTPCTPAAATAPAAPGTARCQG